MFAILSPWGPSQKAMQRPRLGHMGLRSGEVVDMEYLMPVATLSLP